MSTWRGVPDLMEVRARQGDAYYSVPLPSLLRLGFMETSVRRKTQAAVLAPSACTSVPLKLYEACEQTSSMSEGPQKHSLNSSI